MPPASGPKVTFERGKTDINHAFTNRAKLPFAMLDSSHIYRAPSAKDTPAKIVHAVEIRGFLAPLFGVLIGRSIKKNLRTAMIKLSDLAK